MTAVSATALDELVAALPSGRLVSDPASLQAYARDQASLVHGGTPLGAVEATSTGDVVATLRWASGRRVPVVPRGAGTGLSGGAAAIDGCLVLSLARMTRIVELSPEDRLVVTEPGVVTADLDRTAAGHDLMYAPDPSSYETSTIGGNIATNAGGLRCVKYGVTRDSVLGLEVVLSDGRVLRTGRRTVKGVTGYDLTALFVGSEGTLGVVTEATLRLWPRPLRPPATVAASFRSARAAADAVTAILQAPVDPSLLEMLDRATLQAIDDWKHIGLGQATEAMVIAQADSGGPEAAETMARCCRRAGADEVAVSTDPEEVAQLVGIRRLAYPAVERLGPTLVEDVAVPRSRVPDMVDRIQEIGARHGVFIATVSHAGDGNLHPVFVFRPVGGEAPPEVWAAADEIFRAALGFGGTLTGEHGVGTLKRRWLRDELGDVGIDVHQAIKRALDPSGILNPGKAI